MMIKAYCNKCGETGTLDIGDMTKEEIIECLKKQKTFNCFGNHVELTSPLKYWEIDWESAKKGNAPTEEEFIADLKSKYNLVLDTNEIKTKYNIEDFSYGMAVARDKETNTKIIFDFISSPKGKRYYIA